MKNHAINAEAQAVINDLYGFDVSKLDARLKEQADEILERKLYAEVVANAEAGRKDNMTPDERKVCELEIRLLRAKLELVNREIEAFDQKYTRKPGRYRESKHASSRIQGGAMYE